MSTTAKKQGFSAEEKAAMKERAAELNRSIDARRTQAAVVGAATAVAGASGLLLWLWPRGVGVARTF